MTKNPYLKYCVSSLLIVSTFSFGLRASDEEKPVYSAAVQVLYDHLQKLELTASLSDIPDASTADGSEANDGKYHSLGSLLVGTVNDYLSRGWCPADDSREGYERIDCLKANFSKTVDMARKEGALDSVETAIYRYYTDSFTFRDDGTFNTDPGLLYRLANPNKAPKRNQTDLPTLADYRFKKFGLEETRKKSQPGSDGKLKPELIQLLSSAYKKKIRGMGEVDSLDYAIAKYDRLQLGELGLRMRKTLRLITSDTRLVSSGSPIPFDYGADGKPIGLDDDEEIVGKDDVIHLTNSDAYAFAINNLQYQIERSVKGNGQTYLKGFRGDITLEDVMLAGVLTGKVDQDWVIAILKFPEFRQPKPDLSKLTGFLGDVARALMITQPEILPFYMLGSIVFDTIKRNKDDRKDFNNETRRILIRNPR